MEEKWMEGVTMDMLPEAHRKFAEVIGVEATLKLCAMWGGDDPYIPMADTIYLNIRDKMIRKEYANGYTIPRLAKRYHLSKRTIRKKVQDIRPIQESMLGPL